MPFNQAGHAYAYLGKDVAVSPDKIHNLAEKRILRTAKLSNETASSRQNANFKLSIYRD